MFVFSHLLRFEHSSLCPESDLIAPGQAVHLHQLTLRVQHQLSEGEELRGQGALGKVSVRIHELPQLFQSLNE